MTTAQRIIKYCALAFAAFLIISIFAGIVKSIGIVGRIIDRDNGEGSTVASSNSQTYDDVASLEMDIEGAEVYVKVGDQLKAETNSKNIQIKQTENKLVIEEDDDNWFSNDEDYVTIYIPEDMVFDRVDMSAGAGIIEIENINANYFDMELGAGKATISQINVYNQSEIEGGAGKIDVQSGKLTNLKMDIGAGSAKVNGDIAGESNFDVGVGKLELGLTSSEADYTIQVNKGIGDITVGDINASDGTIIGSGMNKIQLDGGIGSIKVTFQNMI